MAERWNMWNGAEVRPGQIYHKQNFALAVVVGTPFISAGITGLRFYAKRKTGWGWDDLAIAAATLMSMVIIYPSYRYIKLWKIGIHFWDINQRKQEPPMHENYVMQVWLNTCNAFVLPLVKASILLLLLQVGGILNSLRKLVYVLFTFNAVTSFIFSGFFLFMCPPKTGNTWEPTTFGGAQCAGRLLTGRLNIAQVCVSMFTDLLIFPIPCYLTYKLQKASIRNRIILVLLFSLSLVVTGISAAKIYYTYLDRLYVTTSTTDWTWDIVFTITHWENCAAIVVACIPSIRVLIIRWLGKNEDENSRATGASPMRITGGPTAVASAAAMATQKSGRASFLQKFHSGRRGLHDTTIGEHTIDIDLESRVVVKTDYDFTVTVEEEETASCGSGSRVLGYSSKELHLEPKAYIYEGRR